MKYYTYYSYEPWGRGYIGSKPSGCEGDPLLDGYFGSYSDISFKPTEKIILGVYDTPEKCLAAEVVLHKFFEVDKNPHFANRAKLTSSGFSYSGGHPGEKNGMYGKTHTPEAKRAMAEARSIVNKNSHWISNGEQEKFVLKSLPIPDNWYVGRSKHFTSPVVKSGSENTSFGKKWFNNGTEELFALPSEVDETWEVGRLIGSCPHCGKSASAGMLKRWHFKNCKLLEKS